MHNAYRLSIITVNYNGLKDTCELIATIPVREDVEVIVVDNHSVNDEASAIEAQFPHVVVIRSQENLGFAGGNNLGIQAATGDYLFLVNNDTLFLDFSVEALIRRLNSSPRIGVVCPKIRFSWGSQPIQFTGYTPLSPVTMRNRSIGYGEQDQGQYDQPRRTPYAHGAAMMLKREVIGKAGLMPECYFLYYEELDWSVRIVRAGYEIWYDPGCTIYHKESQTTGQNSPLRAYYITRNRLLFVSRNVSGLPKYLSYAYQLFLVGGRDVVKYILQGRISLCKAVVKGISDFVFKPLSSQPH